MKIPILLLALTLSVTGCAHHARHYAPPDPGRMNLVHEKLTAQIVEARLGARKVSTAVAAARVSHAKEAARLAVIEPKIGLLRRASPSEMRPLVESVASEVEALKAEQAAHEGDLASVVRAQEEHATQIEGTAAQVTLAAQERTNYIAATRTITEQANASELGWARDSQSLAWYRMHFWLSWIVAGAGVAVCLLLAFLKFTGRLTSSAASIAPQL